MSGCRELVRRPIPSKAQYRWCGTDGEHFRVFATLEDAVGQYSYPAIIQAPDGSLEMTYTWQRKTIKYVHLPLASVPQH